MLNAHQLVTDSALAMLGGITDPAVPVFSSKEAINLLRSGYIIDTQRYTDSLNESEKAHVVTSLARSVHGILNALRGDDLYGLVAHSAALAAKIEVTQHSWGFHQGQVADAANLLLEIERELVSLSFLIRPARLALVSGLKSASHCIDVAHGTSITSRALIVQSITASGLRARLESLRYINSIAMRH